LKSRETWGLKKKKALQGWSVRAVREQTKTGGYVRPRNPTKDPTVRRGALKTILGRRRKLGWGERGWETKACQNRGVFSRDRETRPKEVEGGYRRVGKRKKKVRGEKQYPEEADADTKRKEEKERVIPFLDKEETRPRSKTFSKSLISGVRGERVWTKRTHKKKEKENNRRIEGLAGVKNQD